MVAHMGHSITYIMAKIRIARFCQIYFVSHSCMGHPHVVQFVLCSVNCAFAVQYRWRAVGKRRHVLIISNKPSVCVCVVCVCVETSHHVWIWILLGCWSSKRTRKQIQILTLTCAGNQMQRPGAVIWTTLSCLLCNGLLVDSYSISEVSCLAL